MCLGPGKCMLLFLRFYLDEKTEFKWAAQSYLISGLGPSSTRVFPRSFDFWKNYIPFVFLANWIIVLGHSLALNIFIQHDGLSLWFDTVATSDDSEKDPARNHREAPQVSQHHTPENKARGALVPMPRLHSPWPRDPAERWGLDWRRADADRQWARWVWRDRKLRFAKDAVY